MSNSYLSLSNSALHIKNTPIKSTATRTAGPPMNAEEVKQVLKDELENGNYHVTTTQDLLRNLFPISENLIHRVYDRLVTDKLYNKKTGRWKKLYGVQGGKEDRVYGPLVDTMESIRNAACDLISEKPPLQTQWVDRHNEAPSSIIPESPTLRPDIINILQSRDEDVEEQVQQAVKEDEKAKVIKAWWHRVNSVTEVKTKKSPLPHIYQLLVYMRQILAEQLDRRFVFGTLYCEGFLSVWLADRSGVLGTADAINIHAEPFHFIRVIVAMSFLSPVQLGWDTTMRICRQSIIPSDIKTFPSFDPSVKLCDYNDSASRVNWAIDMPSKGNSAERELFITVRALDISRACCMSGRATIIWAALRAADLCKSPSTRKIYVLKQTWRPATAVLEGDFYPKEGIDGQELVYSYEDVEVDGIVIDTYEFIRRGLKYTFPDVEKKRKNAPVDNDEPLAKYLDIVTENEHQSIRVMHRFPPTWRIQSRTVMAFYGWPLRNFADLPELLLVLKQAMEFHRKLFFIYLTLHRDISINNILIYLNEDRAIIEGRLIDYDYAKRTADVKKSISFEALSHSDRPPIPYFQSMFKSNLGLLPLDDVLYAVLGQTEQIRKFVKYFAHTWRAEDIKKRKYSLANWGEDRPPRLEYSDLGLLRPDANLPDFSTQEPQTSERSATFPYASADILDNMTYIPHEARHDMESFFWVLTELCISRKGPGGKRRDELCEEYDEDSPNAALHLVYHYLFRCGNRDILIKNKHSLFKNNHFEQYVLCHVHPYFEILKPLLLRWWNILLFLNEFTFIENAHDFFIEAIDEEIRSLKSYQPSKKDQEESMSVLDKRAKDLEMLRTLGTEENASGITWNVSPNSKNVPTKGGYTGPGPVPDGDPEPLSPTLGSKRMRLGKGTQVYPILNSPG